MSKKHKHGRKAEIVSSEKEENKTERRTGRAFLWALFVVVGGIGTTGVLIAQTASSGTPEAEAPVEEQKPAPMPASAPEAKIPSSADIFARGETAVGSENLRGSMFKKNSVAVPQKADGMTIYQALEEVVKNSGHQLAPLSTNVVDALQDIYEPPTKETKYDLMEFCRELLPVGYSFWLHDDGVHGFVGTDADINRKQTDYAAEVLANNHTRISFSANDMPIVDAVRRIRVLSGANILTAYMEKDDQRSDAQERGMVTADDLAKSAATNSACRRVTYSTEGAELEWRTVLSSVLEPDYTFDEVDGKVRVALRTKFEEMQRKEINARPMELRYVRVFHANPEDIVARLEKMNVRQNSKAVIEVAPYQEKAKDSVNSFRHNLSATSSRLTTKGSTIGDSSSGSSGSWGNLLRPKNPPAILVYDNAENLDRVEALIRSMDVREKQVLIEALVLTLTDAGFRQLGMDLDKMGFSSFQLLNVSWNQSHSKNHQSNSTQSWTGGSGQGSNRYVGRSQGTQKATEAVTTTTKGKDGFGNYNETTVTKGGTTSGIAPTWVQGNVIESFSEDHMLNQHTYERSTSSARDHGWSTILGPLDFKLILEMVERNGYGKSLSSPEITIGDHSEAMIHVGDVRPIVQTKVSYAGDNATAIQSYEWEELLLGLHMWVGPEVTKEGDAVRLWVHPKNTIDVGDDVEAPDGSTYPRLRSEEIDTRVTVPSGATLLLGGLTETSSSEIIRKVPILGDIPILGRLFRNTKTETARSNLVILIRPTILDDENPDTGFETPANAIIDPMMAESGRNLQDVVFKDEEDAMKRREKALFKAISHKKSDGFSDVEEEAEEIKDTAEAEESAEASEETASAASDVKMPSEAPVDGGAASAAE